MITKYLKISAILAMLSSPLITLSSLNFKDKEGEIKTYLTEEELYKLVDNNLQVLEQIFAQGINQIAVTAEYADNKYIRGTVVFAESFQHPETIFLMGRKVQVGSHSSRPHEFRVYIAFDSLDKSGHKKLMQHLFGKTPATAEEIVDPNELHVPREDVLYKQEDILKILEAIQNPKLPADVSELFVPPLE